MGNSTIVKSVLKKAASPNHLYTAFRRQRARNDGQRSFEDPQLKLIARICPGDFMNYGYFEDPEVQASDLSANDILRAQTLNAQILVELIRDGESAILDVGCGMGGITRLLLEKGLDPVALSPNKHQIANLKEKYPETRVVGTRFEEMPADDFEGYFDVLLMSESLQYFKLDRALAVADKILKPGGRWIAVDFFRTDEKGERSGHVWETFVSKLDEHGWKIVDSYDHTANMLPLLRYIFMLGNDVLRPIAEFAFDKLKEKQPGVHYLLTEAIDELNRKGEKNLKVIDPVHFAEHKKYVLFTVERK
jgi:SAM-dependent methyltransferase